MVDVITQIEAALRASGVTQLELSRRLGHRTGTAVSRLLSRKHEPGPDMIQACADALGVPLVVPPTPAITYTPRPLAPVANCHGVATMMPQCGNVASGS